MNPVLKVFMVCMSGAAIGTFIAITINPIFWWIGPLIGALIGYLVYDFRQVLRAVQMAGRETWVFGFGILKRTAGYNLHWPRKERIIRSVWILSAWACVIISLVLIMGVMALFDIFVFSPGYPPDGFDEIQGAIWSTVMIIYMILCVIVAAATADNYIDKVDASKKVMKLINPFTVLVRLPIEIVQGIADVIRRTFLIIHSEDRLAVAVDIAVRATIGFFSNGIIISDLGVIIVGALAGGIFGIISFKKVSARMLYASLAESD